MPQSPKDILAILLANTVVFPRPDSTIREFQSFCVARCEELQQIRMALIDYLLERENHAK